MVINLGVEDATERIQLLRRGGVRAGYAGRSVDSEGLQERAGLEDGMDGTQGHCC